MSQAITELGTPSALDTRGQSSFLGETVAIALATGLIYVMAGAYQQGYQDQFGFSYISLGIEDIVTVIRKFLIPLMMGLAVSFSISYIIMLFIKTGRNSQLTSVMFLIAPACICTIFYWWFARSFLNLIDNETYWLILAFYLLDLSIWRALFRLSHSTLFRVPLDLHFRMVQVAIFSIFLVVATYDMGVIDALTLNEMEQCPDLDGNQSVLVQRTTDISVCAQVDFEKRIVYRSFYYFKLPSNGMSKSFRVISFHPDRVGAAQ